MRLKKVPNFSLPQSYIPILLLHVKTARMETEIIQVAKIQIAPATPYNSKGRKPWMDLCRFCKRSNPKDNFHKQLQMHRKKS